MGWIGVRGCEVSQQESLVPGCDGTDPGLIEPVWRARQGPGGRVDAVERWRRDRGAAKFQRFMMFDSGLGAAAEILR